MKEVKNMKKYRYIEFTDGFMREKMPKTGRLYIVAEKPESYVEEFDLTKKGSGYYTTLEKIGELGWELVSVTPCGCFSFSGNNAEMLFNAYVFKKEIEK